MASDINIVALIGRLTRDPELKYIPSGTAVTNFSLANNKTYLQNGEKKEQTSFFNCIAWGKLGEEVIAKYAKKGQQVAIDGSLQQRSWDDKDGNKRSTVEIVVSNFQFIEKKDDSNVQLISKNTGQNDTGQATVQATVQAEKFDDSSIPF